MSFTKHPFLDVGRTVEHRDSLCFALVQEANAFDIQKVHLIQIQRYSRSAATEFGLHLINVLNSKFAT